MAKKHRKKHSQNLSNPSPDARREIAARAVKALRSAETAKFRQDVINLYNREVDHVSNQVRKSRVHQGSRVHASVPLRRVPDSRELRDTRLSPQVRSVLSDAVRGLACASRRARREVMFALRKAGKAGKGNRKAKWTDKSYMRCK